MNDLLVLKLYQLLNGDFFFRSTPTAAKNCVKCAILEFRSQVRVSELRPGCPSLGYVGM